VEITGSLNVSGSIVVTGSIVGVDNLVTTSSFNAYTTSVASVNTSSLVTTSSFNTFSSSINTFTSSINTTIKNKLNSDGVISGSSQVTGSISLTNITGSNITATTLFTGFGVSEGKITVLTSKPIVFYPNVASESVRFTTAGGVLIGGNHTENIYKLSVSGSTRVIGSTSLTGSLVVSDSITGSNALFSGSLNVSGSLIITGSARGNVVPITIVSSTASLDMTSGSYFTLTLADTTNTHIRVTSITPGVNATLLVTTGTNSSASLSPLLLQPSGSSYTASLGSGKKDVLSLVAFDSTNMYVVSTKAMQ
jgi:hypothetical protein